MQGRTKKSTILKEEGEGWVNERSSLLIVSSGEKRGGQRLHLIGGEVGRGTKLLVSEERGSAS